VRSGQGERARQSTSAGSDGVDGFAFPVSGPEVVLTSNEPSMLIGEPVRPPRSPRLPERNEIPGHGAGQHNLVGEPGHVDEPEIA
jgi:hypothetical protein